MSSSRWLCGVLGLWVLTLTGPVARAGNPEGEARAHFDKGEAHYKLGRFQDALQEYSAAYEVLPLPGFLFNIGQCHRQLGNHERAIFFFEGYLREKPDARNRAVVAELILKSRKLLEAQLAEQHEQQEVVRRTALLKQEQENQRLTRERLAAQERQAIAEKERLEALAASRAIPPATTPPAFYKTWWFWTLVGGVAIATSGAAIALTAGGSSRLPAGSLGTLDLR